MTLTQADCYLSHFVALSIQISGKNSRCKRIGIRWLQFVAVETMLNDCCTNFVSALSAYTFLQYTLFTVFKLSFKPHRSTYVDVAYCYRPSSVVCRSIGRSATVVSPTKTAEPSEMPFELRNRVDPRNQVSDRVQVGPTYGKAKF